MKLTLKKTLQIDLTCISLISKKMLIVDSIIKNQIGISGVLVKETANFIFLKVDATVKSFKKSDLIVEFDFEGSKIRFNCNAIIGTIQNRIKKLK